MSDRSSKRVLIAEDAALIGLMLEDELQSHGFTVVGPFASCASAMDALKVHPVDAAVIDVALLDGPCSSLALALHGMRVPFIVVSAYTRASTPPEFHAAFSWLAKPAPATEFVAELHRLFAMAAKAEPPTAPFAL